MDQTNLKVNRLPVPTWNWLKMNGTQVSVLPPREEGECNFSIPDGFVEAPDIQMAEIEGNAGPDMERLVKESGVGALNFFAQGSAEPLRLDFSYKGSTSALNAVGLETSAGSEASLIMDFRSASDASGLVAVQTKIKVGDNSTLKIVQVQRLEGEMKFFNDLGIFCGENAKVSLIQLVLAGKETFTGCRCVLDGEGSIFNADVGYLLGDDQRLDMNYWAIHGGARSISDINASGVLRGNAYKLFRGTIDFRRGAAHSVGGEKEDVLLMSDDAVNGTIPLLLCGEEDVEGNHGATIGRLDDALVFYLESRGLNRESAYEMMAQARIDAVCQKITDENLRREIFSYMNGGKSDE